jgi:5-methylcytosine-specific restriction enzyme B
MAGLAHPALYEAMAVVIQHGLKDDSSAFTPGTPVWTRDNFAALRKHFIDQPDESSDRSFVQKVERQLAGAPRLAIQLMVELNYVYFLLPDSVSGAKKRETLTALRRLMQEPPAIPERLDTALDHGFINPGTFFMTRRDRQVTYLIEFGEAWKSLPRGRVDYLLSDPWAFKEFAFSVPVGSAYAMREGLLHLVFPDTFASIVSRDHKQLVAKRFGSLVTRPDDDVDRQLLQIQRGLAERHGETFTFYDPAIKPLWQKEGGAWDAFVRWAKRLYAEPQFVERERTYKLDLAGRLKAVREALLRGDEWRSALTKVFKDKRNNLTDWRLHDRYLEWMAAQESSGAGDGGDAGDAALRALWKPGDVGPRIDAFLAVLPKSVVSGPGSRLNLATFLLMASESPTEYPIYKPTPFRKAHDLTQTALPSTSGSPSETYLSAIDFSSIVSSRRAPRAVCSFGTDSMPKGWSGPSPAGRRRRPGVARRSRSSRTGARGARRTRKLSTISLRASTSTRPRGAPHRAGPPRRGSRRAPTRSHGTAARR